MPNEQSGAEAGSPTSEDIRVRRTRRLLSDAMIQLALDRPFELITVRDLTDRAGIGYATFFRHYAGKEELLRTMLQELLDDLQVLVLPYAGEDPVSAAVEVFRHAQRNAHLYRLLLRTAHAIDLLPAALQVGAASIRENYRPREESSVPFEVATEHLVRSFIGLIEWWLESDMPYPPERMASIYDELVRQPLEATSLEPVRRPSQPER